MLLLVTVAAALCAPQQSNRALSSIGRAPVLGVVPARVRQVISGASLRGGALPMRMRGAIKASLVPSLEPEGVKAWLLRNRTILLLIALVLQKTSVYSASSVALLSEVVKFPLLIVAVAIFGGGWKMVKPTLKATTTDRPFSLVGVSLCYSAQNILYFLALSHLSAESYQRELLRRGLSDPSSSYITDRDGALPVHPDPDPDPDFDPDPDADPGPDSQLPNPPMQQVLSQSKLLFTAGLMMGIMKTRLRINQWTAIGMLIFGSLLVQLSEATKSVVLGGNAYLGGFYAILGSLLSSLPNVYYEKLLKEPDTNEWARNIQMTGWIFLWILFSMFFEGKGLSALDLTGFSFNVWVIIALKALNCLLIPGCVEALNDMNVIK
ncbi:nucleotide-sugar transporter-domain-containing protein [Pavlovales sp. CCMP2436]|nr:nucleotide-sugar transporter-domain-containing protein [Pavlovales sp. CCMP2436]